MEKTCNGAKNFFCRMCLDDEGMKAPLKRHFRSLNMIAKKYKKLPQNHIKGRPLKDRNILGCSGAISLHLHVRVLPGINRFQIN